jgi:hypothetical protein
MSGRQILTSARFTALELARNRIAITLVATIPGLFDALIVLTTTDRPVMFEPALVAHAAPVQVGARAQALVFMGLVAASIITSFLALNLLTKRLDLHRRLVLCGYRPAELLLGKLVVLLAIVTAIALYVGGLCAPLVHARHFWMMVLGFALAGLVYGGYGLLIGALFQRELEGVMALLLLVNIDVGWLQNPLFYEGSTNRALIHSLPAYYPSQLSVLAAFTDHPVGSAAAGSLLYAGAFLAAAIAIFWRRARTLHRRSITPPRPTPRRS